jgi:hypothetical protein
VFCGWGVSRPEGVAGVIDKQDAGLGEQDARQRDDHLSSREESTLLYVLSHTAPHTDLHIINQSTEA